MQLVDRARVLVEWRGGLVLATIASMRKMLVAIGAFVLPATARADGMGGFAVLGDLILTCVVAAFIAGVLGIGGLLARNANRRAPRNKTPVVVGLFFGCCWLVTAAGIVYVAVTSPRDVAGMYLLMAAFFLVVGIVIIVHANRRWPRVLDA